VRAIKKSYRRDYALFSWVRDSYASAERQAAMVVLAFVGVAWAAACRSATPRWSTHNARCCGSTACCARAAT